MKDLKRLIKIDHKFEAADALGYTLYGTDDSRIQEFKLAFFEGISDYQVGIWGQVRGVGPWSIGYLLGAVWGEKETT